MKGRVALLGGILALCALIVFWDRVPIAAQTQPAQEQPAPTRTASRNSPPVEGPFSPSDVDDSAMITTKAAAAAGTGAAKPQSRRQRNHRSKFQGTSPPAVYNATTQVHDGRDYCFETPDQPLLRERVISSSETTKEYLKDIILMHMVSPTRYQLVPLLFRHYRPFFSHQVFTGPKNGTVWFLDKTTGRNESYTIEGHDVVFGTMQYTALAAVIQRIEEGMTAKERVAAGLPERVAGYFFLGDDMILQPWMLVGRNKNVAWCAGMGIANAQNYLPVKPVPAMSAERRFAMGKWPFWFQGRVKLLQVLEDPIVDADAKANLARAAELTPASVYKYSGYKDGERQFCCTEKMKPFHVFYTIVDAFYVPTFNNSAVRWARFAWVARKNWLHLETAIPSTLRMVSPTYEVLRLQYYWSSVSAKRCKRTRWSVTLDGFHRCRHDHGFPMLLFNMTHEERLLLLTDVGKVNGMKKDINYLDLSWNPSAYSAAEFDDRLKNVRKK